MRALFTPNARPRLGPSHSLSSITVRRTVFPPTRRKLTFCDAFTILLAPVLTAAFVADVTHKDRRRQAWDKKIAQIEEEIEVLKEREVKSWSNLQLRSVGAGVFHQRRGYATSAVAVSTRDPSDVDDEFLGEVDQPDMDRVPPAMLKKPSKALLSDWHRYENLIAIKMGLQMLLHIRTGQEITGRWGTDEVIGASSDLDSIDDLIKRLRRVESGLRRLSDNVADCYPDLEGQKERQELDEKIASLSWECRTGTITVPELILGYTNAVLKSRTGPSIRTYRLLTETFSTLNNQPLIYLSMYPFRITRQILTDRTIWTILCQYGRIKDAKRFDQFLTLLILRDRRFTIANAWETVDVDGVRVPAPINRRARLLDILLRSALQNNQPHRARAWGVLLLEQGESTGRIAALINNFLTYCSESFDWEAGQSWLKKTIICAALLAETSPQMLQRVIFRMLDLCVSCSQPQYFDKILAAAITAGLDVPPEDTTRPDLFSDRAREIRDHWSAQIQKSNSRSIKIEGVYNAAKIFQTELGKLDSSINEFIGVKDLKKLPALLGKYSVSRALNIDYLSDKLTSSSDLVLVKGLEPPASSDAKPNDGGFTPDGALERQLHLLQRAHEDLQDKYHAQQSLNSELEKLASKARYRPNTGFEVQQLTRKLMRNQEIMSQLQEENIHLGEKMNKLGRDKVELQSSLTESNEATIRLDRLCGEIRSQLDETKHQAEAGSAAHSQAMQAMSSENELLKREIMDLKNRYVVALGAKDNLDEKFAFLQVQHEKLRKERSSELYQLQQAQKALETQLSESESQHRRLLKVRLAREESLHRKLSISEQKLKDLRIELASANNDQANGQDERAVKMNAAAPNPSAPHADELGCDFKIRRFQTAIHSGA